MLDKLRSQADLLLNEDYDKYSIIKDILSNDNCFFELSVEEAYSILKDLNVKESDINKVYLSLISKEEYDKQQ